MLDVFRYPRYYLWPDLVEFGLRWYFKHWENPYVLPSSSVRSFPNVAQRCSSAWQRPFVFLPKYIISAASFCVCLVQVISGARLLSFTPTGSITGSAHLSSRLLLIWCSWLCSLQLSSTQDGIYVLRKAHMFHPISQRFAQYHLWNGSIIGLKDRLSGTASFCISLLPVINSVMSLTLCPQVVSQALRGFRPSACETQATCDGCLAWLQRPELSQEYSFSSHRVLGGCRTF